MQIQRLNARHAPYATWTLNKRHVSRGGHAEARFSGTSLDRLQRESAAEYEENARLNRIEALEKEYFVINETSFTGKMILEALDEACKKSRGTLREKLSRLLKGGEKTGTAIWLDQFSAMVPSRQQEVMRAFVNLNHAGFIRMKLRFFKGDYRLSLTPEGRRILDAGANASIPGDAKPAENSAGEPDDLLHRPGE